MVRACDVRLAWARVTSVDGGETARRRGAVDRRAHFRGRVGRVQSTQNAITGIHGRTSRAVLFFKAFMGARPLVIRCTRPRFARMRYEIKNSPPAPARIVGPRRAVARSATHTHER